MNDFSGYLFDKKRAYFKLFLCKVSSFYTRLQFKIKGIKYGVDLKTWRSMTVSRHPDSRIIIGINCSFRSDVDSNLIGLNHRCILSTHDASASIIIGNNCGFSGSSISARREVTIGNNVLVGANSMITDFDWHSIDAERRLSELPKSSPVHIGDNVWIGASCIVLKGVTIGVNTVIGAGSVVTKSIPANVLAGGNPCKVIRAL